MERENAVAGEDNNISKRFLLRALSLKKNISEGNKKTRVIKHEALSLGSL